MVGVACRLPRWRLMRLATLSCAEAVCEGAPGRVFSLPPFPSLLLENRTTHYKKIRFDYLFVKLN